MFTVTLFTPSLCAGPLLNRQRSTNQVPACSGLYDQMVARRLVGAIAAWHDLHASLLQLSLRQTNGDGEAEEEETDAARMGDARKTSTRRKMKRQERQTG